MRSSFLVLIFLAGIAYNVCLATDMPFGTGLNLNEEPGTPLEPEISRIICACNEKKSEKCINTPTLGTTTTMKPETEFDAQTIEELKEVTAKLETLLHKKVFKNIVKRSVDQDNEVTMKKMFDSMKKMFDLNDNTDFQAFKIKLMSIPEDRKVPLSSLIKMLKPDFVSSTVTVENNKNMNSKSECEEKSKIECGAGKKLKIIRGTITNKNKNTCPSKTLTTSTESTYDVCTEELETIKILNEKCNGKESCELSVDNDFEDICQCAENKYLNMTYSCVEDSSSRSKRAIHYRNRPNQMDRDRRLRGLGGYGLGYGGFGGYGGYGLGGYGGFGYGYPIYDYYGYGYPLYDYYGYGYGYPIYDYYGYGYGIPVIYDY